VQRLEFSQGVFKTMQKYVAEDRALNALCTSICMSATSAIMADAHQQHLHRSLTASIETFALTPAMCRSICEADASCESMQILIVRKIATCMPAGDDSPENAVAHVPTDTEVVLQTRICEFAKTIKRADQVIRSAEALMCETA
jgi:hypothetical protein